MVYASHQANDFIQKNALTSGVINAIINGAIGWFMFQGKETIPLTVDTISAHEKTVFSTGVMTAFTLSLILGTIAFFTFGKKSQRFLDSIPGSFGPTLFIFWGENHPILFSVCLRYGDIGGSVLTKVFGDDSGDAVGRCHYLGDYRGGCLLVY